ncbi:hypothetical protein FB451DRAFT_1180710 [Mycena latifolia]|nr:hypothetical protein FB451DRAFT_1180710 [Mycena latifolia]
MTALDSTEFEDPEFLFLIANLDLRDVDQGQSPSPAQTPPRTPSPRPPPYSPPALRTVPQVQARTQVSTTSSPTIYHYASPARRGYTTDWYDPILFASFPVLTYTRAVAASATQGVPRSSVRAVHHGSPSPSKRRGKKVAYVVFCGKRCGVFHTWAETEPLVSGVASIFRGYASVADAQAAFAYAQARSWIRSSEATVSVAIPALPRPHSPHDTQNPLNGSEQLDDRWYIVYQGICPGIYRSHLESQLNTLAIRGAVHESVTGESAARSKYARALRQGNTKALLPTYTIEASDPFL